MRIDDTLAGMLLCVVGLATIGYAQTFPASPGQSFGPGLFPQLIGGGLVCGGLALAWGGLRDRRGPRIEWGEWIRQPGMGLNGALAIAAVIFYALAVDRVGFFLTAFSFLVVLLAAFHVKWRSAPWIAAGATLGLHVVFYTLLRVPLPWGWLEGIAW